MPKHDFDQLFDTINQLAVGFDPLFRSFPISSSGYPPHNIIKRSDNLLMLELAVAGFKKHEVKIEMKENTLTITGEQSGAGSLDEEYQYRGLASRNFSKQFKVAEYYEVTSARLEDGILSIVFTKNVPE